MTQKAPNSVLSAPGGTAKVQRKARRRHKNSKNGCARCKARKLKCDETLPRCQNCVKRDLTCPYQTLTPYQAHLISKAHEEAHGKSEMLFHNQDNTFMEYPSTHSVNLQREQPYSDKGDSVFPQEGHGSMETSALAQDNRLEENRLTDVYYQATDMEHILLNQGPGRAPQLDLAASPEYTPVKSNQVSFGQVIKKDANATNMRAGSLSASSKVVNKAFKLNGASEAQTRLQELTRIVDIVTHINNGDAAGLFLKYGMFDIDSESHHVFYKSLIMCAPFSKLMAKSLLLYSADCLKNTILRQPILEGVEFTFKMGMSCSCENYSVQELEAITHVINYEYLANYHLFDINLVEILMGSFIILNHCFVYHFKSGIATELSQNEAMKCVSKFGIFNAGLFSITMDKSPFVQEMKGVSILASNLLLMLKSMLKPALRWDHIDDMRRNVIKLSSRIISGSKVSVHYDNLKMFLDKHTPLLKSHIEGSDTFLGLGEDNGYVIRLMNEFYQIMPCDLGSLVPGVMVSDEMFAVYLSFIGTAALLSNILPAAVSITTNNFLGPACDVYSSRKTEVLMSFFSQMTNNVLKEHVMYLIRMITILKDREQRYKKFLLETNFRDLTEPEDGMSIDERCRRLKHIRELGIMSETPMRSFKLDRGDFYEVWNVPRSIDNTSIEYSALASQINNVLPTLDDKVANFLESNNGLFTRDYSEPIDAIDVMQQLRSIVTEATPKAAATVTAAWRISVHIRMNNI